VSICEINVIVIVFTSPALAHWESALSVSSWSHNCRNKTVEEEGFHHRSR